MGRFSRIGSIYWHTYLVLVILLLTFFIGKRIYCDYIRDPLVVYVQLSPDSVAKQPKKVGRRFKVSPAPVNVNTAPARRLRRLGFSYYEITQMLQFRLHGFYFDSVPDLLCIRFIDSAHVQEVAPMLSFSRDTSGQNIRDFSPFDSYNNREWTENRRSYEPRRQSVPLFLADSIQMLQAGMDPDAWDTLALYQRSHILRGSAPIDSLVGLNPSQLGSFLASRSSGLRTPAFQPEQKRVIPIVELNSATADLLVQLPYVGETSAAAIVEYRERLGGFVNARQLLDVWTIDSVRFEKIEPYVVVDSSSVHRVNVNSSNDTRMRRHPYFGRAIANKLWQTRLRKRNKPLAEENIRQAIAGETLSPYFWSYVAYSD